ncbi:hypothetical protein [Helicobacter pylori]|uniref:hypothetical protein n=1 Tax=Helicobacter pylori TaxID=210 RepID=UPI001FD098BE|nr:hypothetical protein [Helicobacter pylori]UOR44642.1 hypothetical protein MPG32_05655 [Helicobacter pylori]UOR45055.1 hypothetical protein MPG32_00570 [Helicobacter pylori]
MGFQNENQLKVGALVKATINGKVVEAKVISIGFNRVTLRSEKGNEVSYAFNSEKFLKWFNHTPLSEVAKNHADKSVDDLLKGIKIVTSGPTIKERTTTPKEKEDKYKLVFGFNEEGVSSAEIMIESYTLEERKSRLGVLLSPMFYEDKGNQITAIIITALAHAKDLNKHSDAEWSALIENRNTDGCYWDSFDDMDREDIRSFCNLIVAYANDEKREIILDDLFSKVLPKDKNEALFVAQLLCDGGINKYGLSCAGLTENLLKDIEPSFGLATPSEIDEYLANLDKEGEIE